MHVLQAKTLAPLVVVVIGCRSGESRIPDSTTASTTIASTTASTTISNDRVVDPQSRVDSGPAGVVRRYYAAIQSRLYSDAYALWSDSGRSSGKTAQDFAGGFSETARVSVRVADSVRIGAAAGSQYATVPVVVDATLNDGQRQRFVGSYILRRAMVDGATPEQRQWRIYSAHLQKE